MTMLYKAIQALYVKHVNNREKRPQINIRAK